MIKTMTDKKVDFTAKVWQTYVSKKKNGDVGGGDEADSGEEEEDELGVEVGDILSV